MHEYLGKDTAAAGGSFPKFPLALSRSENFEIRSSRGVGGGCWYRRPKLSTSYRRI